MRHVYDCPMRWADLDLQGHVNNVVYVDYLQEARVDMLRIHSPGSRAAELAEGVVVVRHAVTYLAPLRLRFRPVRIECWVTEIRAASFTMAYEIFHEDADHPSGRQVYVRASTVLTPYVFASERPRRITPEERATLELFLEPPEGERPAPLRPLRREGAVHHPVHVRFSDVDVYGHVNNVTYFEYFQEARIRLHAGLLGDAEDESERHMVVAQTDVDYRVPILFRPEPYDCWSRVVRVGERSMTIESEICDEDVLLSRARVTMVFVDASGRAVAPDPAYRERLLAAATD
ncbi:acyl-CoA thioesterase [Nocardioides lijunqiniae]|uniref:acyl-CoA thioesterase n=1 Tax=Nocardioides lijunqiniae TaxID=2760832 RepID=UPI001877E075|nr:thioesterase family protein [Nocardioides lijunqiniae]